MLNFGSEFYSYTQKKSSVQWNSNLKEQQRSQLMLTEFEKVMVNLVQTLISDKRIMCKRNYKGALNECRRNDRKNLNINFEDKLQNGNSKCFWQA